MTGVRQLLARLAAAALAAVPALALAQTWTVRTERDRLTDEMITTAASAGSRYAVYVRCTDKVLDVYVDPREFLNLEPTPVRYRIDGGELQSGRWEVSTDGDAVFADLPYSFARSLAAGAQLIFEVEDFRGTAHRRTISLRGSAGPINRVLTACPPPAPPPPPPSETRVVPSTSSAIIRNPVWARVPTGQQISDAFPERALRLSRSGAVALQCAVLSGGEIGSCVVTFEEPPGFGFGDAALKLTRFYRMGDLADGSDPAGGIIEISVQFK